MTTDRMALEIGRALRERVVAWGDGGHVAAVAADLLLREIGGGARIFVLRRQPDSSGFVLLGAAPEGVGFGRGGGQADDAPIAPGIEAGRGGPVDARAPESREAPSEDGQERFVAPITTAGRILGQIEVRHSSLRAISTRDELATEVIAGYLAVAWDASADVLRSPTRDGVEPGRPSGETARVATVSRGLEEEAAPERALARNADGARAHLQCEGSVLVVLRDHGSVDPERGSITGAALVAEIGHSLKDALGIDEALSLVAGAAEVLVGGGYAGVALLEEGGERLRIAGAAGKMRDLLGSSVPIGGADAADEDILKRVAIGGGCLETVSLSSDARGWAVAGLGPGILLALQSRGRIGGVLFAGRDEGAPPPRRECVEELWKLAHLTSHTLEETRLSMERDAVTGALRATEEDLVVARRELAACQERLVVLERMASLGRVAAGIAHEINSPLAGILNCLQLTMSYASEYRDSVGDPEVTAEDHTAIAGDILATLTLAEEATRRIARLVLAIKGQARPEDEGIVLFDPAEEAEGTLLLLMNAARNAGIVVESKLQPGLRVRGDRSRFSTLLQKLVHNAIDSHGGGPGDVRVTLYASGDWVILEVRDEGRGIPEEIRSRIHEHLSIPEDAGGGTGLGLSLVYDIVTSHFGGSISCRSNVTRGTTFEVSVPMAAGS